MFNHLNFFSIFVKDIRVVSFPGIYQTEFDCNYHIAEGMT